MPVLSRDNRRKGGPEEGESRDIALILLMTSRFLFLLLMLIVFETALMMIQDPSMSSRLLSFLYPACLFSTIIIIFAERIGYKKLKKIILRSHRIHNHVLSER